MSEKERQRILHNLAPKDWDMRPLSIAHEMAELIQPIRDKGTGCDSGLGLGGADLWVIIQGVEYHIRIKPSGRDLSE